MGAKTYEEVVVGDLIEATFIVARLVRDEEREPDFWACMRDRRESAREFLNLHGVECVHELSLVDMLDFHRLYCRHPRQLEIRVE